MGNAFYIVEIDRVKYSNAARAAKALLGAEGLDLLNRKTQSCIDFGLNAVGVPRDEFVLVSRGDDAIIFFKTAVLVHDFAQAVHKHTQTVNTTVDSEYRCWFRIGCGYDEDVIMQDNKLGQDPPSYGRAIANRLRQAAKPGELLIDSKTYTELPLELKKKYGREEEIQEKDHDELFKCHRWTTIPDVANKLSAESEDINKRKLENDLEICKKKLLVEPNDLNLLREITHLAIELEDIEQVESTVNEASLIAPNQHGFLVSKGDLLFGLRKYNDAIISYYKAIGRGLGSKDYRVWLKLARSYFLIEDYLNAVTSYEKALTLCYKKAPTLHHDSEDDYLIFHEYAVTLDKLNRHHESIQLYNSSLCLQHNYRLSSYAKKSSYRKIYS